MVGEQIAGPGANEDGQKRGPSDRLGDRSMIIARWVVANPALSIAAATVVLFAIARIPAEIFYARFDLRPEDVGLNSVQVLLQGTTTVLAISLAISVIYGIFIPMLTYGYSVLIAWLFAERVRIPAYRGPKWSENLVRMLVPTRGTDHRAQLRRILRIGPLVITVLTLVIASVVMVSSAISEADAIEAGTAPRSKLGLFHVEHVEASWITNGARPKLPRCSDLYYLGEGDGRIALFDTASETTLRIKSDELRLVFPDDCS